MTLATPAGKTVMNSFVINNVSGLSITYETQRDKIGFVASSFSLQSKGVTMKVGSFSEQSTSLGNQVNVPVFGVKPDLDDAYRTYNIQAGANIEQSIGLKISKLSTTRLNIVNTDLTSHETAGKAITVIHDSIERISKERSSIGAYQNRLEHTMQNSSNTSENLQSAESRIRDLDMAVEMVKFSKHNILEQASQAMLSQANQSPQGVLNLLK